ncbi:S1 family peptidase [Jiulongibacter sp. NS-SX5]|uniref:S1 family peptidase n=1 Tax=Jiulongibacter sp. NS-SX5 TaxID=3463854 RepID=UPI004059DBF4
MFVKAIEKAKKYTRPVHMISRYFGNDKVIPGAATLFFINKEGYALTCKHVVQSLVNAEQVNKRNTLINTEKHLSDLEIQRKYKIRPGDLLEQKNSFIDAIDRMDGYTVHVHPEFDLALIKFNGFKNLMVTELAVFKKSSNQIREGKFLCRLGYPFPEFNNFKLNKVKGEIEWTTNGNSKSPVFPIEGMVTRFIGNKKGQVYGIEMSTPGLKGQSGGPLFDPNGLICGLQSRTKHLHLGFEIENMEVQSGGSTKTVSNSSFIHLGECIHVDIIKDFLRKHKVDFLESDEELA